VGCQPHTRKATHEHHQPGATQRNSNPRADRLAFVQHDHPFEAEDVPDICAALSDICSRMIDAGLKDLALNAAFLLSALPSSGGMRAEKTDN
jgi:hypothetical protein